MIDRVVAAGGGVAIPSGIVTFLFTDVDGSTRLWAEDRAAMAASLEVHDAILREAVGSHGGYVFTTAGDSFAVAFSRASDAVAAAMHAQAALAEAVWPGPALRVRMGLHLGEAQERGGDYFGPVVNTTARLEAAGHGGQVLLTDPVRQAAEISAQDLGVHRLRDVTEPVQVWQLGNDVFPPLRVVDPRLTNLPAAPTSLVGRSDDLRRVREAMGLSRVVTLTAAGGAGKTRLAVAAGEDELPHRPDGVWFADLTPVSERTLVVPAMASGLGLNLLAGDPSEQVLDFVAGKNLLLIIDNCEHLIDEVAEFAERFLARPGQSTLLATSRERLDVNGEQVIVVPPLATDDEASAAVELFVRRAVELDSTFTLNHDDRTIVARLCRRLDGMPLAIELAAARSSVLSPEELLAGIEDRFALLHGGRRRQRQRTLEATLDWSYHLLGGDEQALLRALGTFVGTFDLDAVAAVAGVSHRVAVDLIDSLIAKSLVVREQTAGRARFRLFETTAAYAQKHLANTDESKAVRDRHLDHYLGLARRHNVPGMFSDLAAVAALGPDSTNIVAAFDWAGSQHRWPEAGQLLLDAFAVFYSYPGALKLVERCLPHLESHPHLAMSLVCNEWILTAITSDFAEAAAAIRRLRHSPSPIHRAHGYALLANFLGPIDTPNAEEILQGAFIAQRTLPPGPDALSAAAFCEAIAGLTALHHQQPERALQHARAVAEAHHELGFETVFSLDATTTAAVAALMLGDPNAALKATAHPSRVGHPFGNGDEIRALAYSEMGELELARRSARAHAQVAATGRITYQATDSLLILAVLAKAEGDTSRAQSLILGMGSSIQGGLLAYSRYFADQLGVGPDFEAAQRAIFKVADAMRLRSHHDVETLRHELRRRGWPQTHTEMR